MPLIKKQLLDWMLSDDTGMSSLSICRWMLGIRNQVFSPPSDFSDRRRCIRLLRIMPEWLQRLDKMLNISNEWKKQIELIKHNLSDNLLDKSDRGYFTPHWHCNCEYEGKMDKNCKCECHLQNVKLNQK